LKFQRLKNFYKNLKNILSVIYLFAKIYEIVEHVPCA